LDQKYFIHPLLKERSILFRQYQNTVLQKTLYKNSLIVVPTSLGKTIITLLICIDILFNWRKSKILILAPSRPLVHQHLDLFKRFTKLGNICFALTGKISPNIRKTIWKSRSIRVYFATPELVRNDLDNNLLKKDEFYLVVFDESHRAVKDYSYTSISKKFYSNNDFNNIPMFLALSASPGSNKEKIQEICSNLYIEQIIVKSEDDGDVLPYVYNIDVKHRYVDLDGKHKEISSILQSLIDDKIKWLIDNNFIKKKKIENVYRKDLLNLSECLKSEITNSDNKNFFLYAALKYQSMSMILLYCRDLVESQGSFSLKKFFNQFEGGDVPTRTYQELLSDPRIQKVLEMLKKDKILFSHPKLLDLLSIVKEFLYSNRGTVSNTNADYADDKDYTNIKTNDGIKESNSHSNSNLNTLHLNEKKKILIFSQYRDTLEEITNLLNEHNIQSKGFYGQSNKKDQKGLNQDKQLSILADFKKGIFPVLVATSVAEEGLDIPNVDLVIFYEPVPSEIRFIQRKGRTGRFSDGKVVVLVANNSIDSKYLEIVQKKIIKMKHILKDIDFILNCYDKRSFSITDRMESSEIDVFNLNDTDICGCGAGDNKDDKDDNDYNEEERPNPIIDSIVSNSSKKIKYFVKKLSYKNKNIDDHNSSYSVNDLEHLYDVSLALDSQKMIKKIQRQIHDLLAKSGKNGLEISYLQEIIKFEPAVIDKAIKNLEKLKRIVWINKKTISLVDSIKFIPGKKYSIFIEKILFGKAIVVVNEKWFASLDYFDYSGPRKLLKKGNVFDIIGDLYKKNGTLHLIVKKTM
jgi:ERCC4-related helicase